MDENGSQTPPSDDDFPLTPDFKQPEERSGSLSDQAQQSYDAALGSLPGVFESSSSSGISAAISAPSSLASSPENEAPQQDPFAIPEQTFSSESSAEVPAEVPAEAPPEAASSPGASTLEKVKNFSESMGLAQAVVPAAYPFSLLIDGPLTQHEKDKLLDVLSRENIGIREVDLEPQFANHRVLIPRISEFAGILLVQALRGTSAEIRLGPSDSIFATEDTRDTRSENAASGAAATTLQYCSVDSDHPAEGLPVTTAQSLPNFEHSFVIDIVVASAALRTELVEAERSNEYQELLDALNRELKYKAYRKGAQGIVNYSWNLMPLSLPTHYRLTVSGTAVKKTAGPGPVPA